MEAAALADGLTEEITTGRTRFSYLRVIRSGAARLSEKSQQHVTGAPQSAAVARYALQGRLRQSGARVRVTVQLIETQTGAHLWGETYERVFNPDSIFEIQDDLVARIVCTTADPYGIVPRTFGNIVRGRAPAELTPYER